MDVRRALLAVLLALAAPAGRAEEAAKPVDVPVGPVTLQIIETDSGEKELRDGTRVLVKDYVISPGLAASFGETRARVFEISQGGNACDGWPAVVTVDKDRKVAIDTTMRGACASFVASADPDGFTFVEAAAPDQNGAVWRFTTDRGLRRLGVLVFRPQPESTWNDIDRMLDHPLSMFSCAPFDAAVRKLTGRQYGEFALRLRVASEVEQKGSYLVAQGCQAHACNSDQGFVVVDRKTHTVFLAMRSDRKLTIWPALAKWSAPARQHFEAWRNQP